MAPAALCLAKTFSQIIGAFSLHLSVCIYMHVHTDTETHTHTHACISAYTHTHTIIHILQYLNTIVGTVGMLYICKQNHFNKYINNFYTYFSSLYKFTDCTYNKQFSFLSGAIILEHMFTVRKNTAIHSFFHLSRFFSFLLTTSHCYLT